MLPHLLAAALLAAPPIHTPYSRHDPLEIRSASVAATVARYGVEDITVDARGTYDNPFDPDDVTLDAEVEPPDGKPYAIPGFLYRAYSRHLEGGKEQLAPAGDPEWHVRICPQASGAYRVTLRFNDRTGVAMKDIQFTATDSSDPGFVQVSSADHHYFEFQNGSSYFPIGANVCWGGDGGTFNYDRWLPKYAAQGCNYLRLWLAPSWVTFALEKPGKPSDGAGIGQFDLGDSWRLDQVLALAARNGMYAMLCIDSYNELRDRDAYNWWEKGPQNRDNGGPLRIWSDFWTSPEMDRLYRNKLRYLVARYGADTHVLSWEFWNEVDLVRDFKPDQVGGWHQRMGDALRALDPYHHLLTTSFSNPMGQRSIDLLPELDYAQTHLYGPQLIGGAAYQQDQKSEWGKPHYIGEVGADGEGPRAKEDRHGVQVHDPLWVSLSTGAAGGAMSWWWDSLIDPNDLYPLYGALHRFTQGIDFAHEEFRQADVAIAYADPHFRPVPGDLVLDGGAVSWAADPANQPQTVSVSDGRMTGPMPSGLLHGVRNHPELHNPLTLWIDEREPTSLLVQILGVSTYGGAQLRVSLDGASVIRKVFQTGENNKDPEAAHRFDGSLTVHVPAGKHRLVVNDPGNDWIRIAYRIPGVVVHTTPVLSHWFLVGDTTALGWFRSGGRSWQTEVVEKQSPPVVPPTVISVPGLAMGAWKAEVWDTCGGHPITTTTISVGLNGRAKLSLPTINSDVAVKLVRVGR